MGIRRGREGDGGDGVGTVISGGEGSSQGGLGEEAREEDKDEDVDEHVGDGVEADREEAPGRWDDGVADESGEPDDPEDGNDAVERPAVEDPGVAATPRLFLPEDKAPPS